MEGRWGEFKRSECEEGRGWENFKTGLFSISVMPRALEKKLGKHGSVC